MKSPSIIDTSYTYSDAQDEASQMIADSIIDDLDSIFNESVHDVVTSSNARLKLVHDSS
ncbi:hypothetical protein HanHA300_Chr10g0379861 [Helianthus annuus]|nr:hypothetical protein HanHA300_Chr10g0379861 [Helianthus annuus]KAJ0531567.1 hypothetical protein HanHA89_Chr10g0402451 [Helianthus annuus]